MQAFGFAVAAALVIVASSSPVAFAEGGQGGITIVVDDHERHVPLPEPFPCVRVDTERPPYLVLDPQCS